MEKEKRGTITYVSLRKGTPDISNYGWDGMGHAPPLSFPVILNHTDRLGHAQNTDRPLATKKAAKKSAVVVV